MVRRRRLLVPLVAVLALALAELRIGSQAALAQPAPDYVPGTLLVKFKAGTSAATVTAVHARHGGRIRKVIPGLEVQIVDVPSGAEAARAAAYRGDAAVLFAEVDGRYSVIGDARPDPDLVQQWQYRNTGQDGGTPGADISAFGAWAVTTGSRSVAIAILDTGIDEQHPDLKRNLTRHVNFSSSDTVSDRFGHGTHVAGSAAAIAGNGRGVVGTCPGCSLYNVKVIADNGFGDWAAVAEGIRWAADNGANVVNMSFAGSSDSSSVEAAVDYAWSKGVLLVAAAGNGGFAAPFFPSVLASVVSVAASDRHDDLPFWSNYGPTVTIGAPGDQILSTAPTYPSTLWSTGPGYGTLSGTSMAAPHVAGTAGLIWSAGLCAKLDNACVRRRVEAGADHIVGTGAFWRYGRLDAFNSLTNRLCLGSGTTYAATAAGRPGPPVVGHHFTVWLPVVTTAWHC